MELQLPEDFDSWSIARKRAFINEIKYNWKYWAREEQLPPPGNWHTWLLLAGRGFGKTRTGAEWVKEKMLKERCIVGIIGMTIGAVRDICLKGPAGLLTVTDPKDIKAYNKSMNQVEFTNGSVAHSFGATDEEKMRGFQCHYAWYDELAAWQNPRGVYDMAQMGLRLGNPSQCVITTTPKPTPLIIELVNRSKDGSNSVILTSGSTFNNAANLDPEFLRQLRERYEGTSLGRQELYADLILEDPGALWSFALIEQNRLETKGKSWKDLDLVEIVVAIDPSMSVETERESETGMIVAGRSRDGKCYILEDCSLLRPSPDAWARLAIAKYHEYQANRIVAEVNQGYDLVTNLLGTVDDKVPIKKVYATRGGKYLRAEPIAALYEQFKVKHFGHFPELEQQMTAWVPGKPSPDRLDAMVWSVTELMLGGGLMDYFSPATLPKLPSIV